MIEAAMVLGLTAIVMARVADMMAENARTVKENAAVGRMREVVAAASKYVEANYSMLSTDTALGGAYVSGGLAVPASDDVAAPAGLTSIQGGGFLPESFGPTNPFGQREWLLVKRHPTTPNRLDMLVVAEGGTPIDLAKLPGVAAKVGAAGGMVSDRAPYSAAEVNGSYGGWTSQTAYWVSTGHTPAVGTLAASLAFETTPVADYLYRVAVPGHTEANQMSTDLDMAGGGTRHSITGVGNVDAQTLTASGSVSANDFKIGDEVIDIADAKMINALYALKCGANQVVRLVNGVPSCTSVDGTPSGAVMGFNLPACPAGWAAYTAGNGRFLVGAGSATDVNGNMASYAVGQTGGENRHTLTVAEMPSHDHQSIRGSNAVWESGGSGEGIMSSGSYDFVTGTSARTGWTGNSQPHENRPPYVAVLWCQKS